MFQSYIISLNTSLDFGVIMAHLDIILLLASHCAQGKGAQHVDEHDDYSSNGYSKDLVLLTLNLINEDCVTSLEVVGFSISTIVASFSASRDLFSRVLIVLSSSVETTPLRLRIIWTCINPASIFSSFPVSSTVNSTTFQFLLNCLPHFFESKFLWLTVCWFILIFLDRI